MGTTAYLLETIALNSLDSRNSVNTSAQIQRSEVRATSAWPYTCYTYNSEQTRMIRSTQSYTCAALTTCESLRTTEPWFNTNPRESCTTARLCSALHSLTQSGCSYTRCDSYRWLIILGAPLDLNPRPTLNRATRTCFIYTEEWIGWQVRHYLVCVCCVYCERSYQCRIPLTWLFVKAGREPTVHLTPC